MKNNIFYGCFVSGKNEHRYFLADTPHTSTHYSKGMFCVLSDDFCIKETTWFQAENVTHFFKNMHILTDQQLGAQLGAIPQNNQIHAGMYFNTFLPCLSVLIFSL